MEERIENIIESIEQSFIKLNTSVELLKKAEEIATSSTATTSSLINEFQTTITSIEKLVKTDFADEYSKLLNIHNQLVERIDTIDFDEKFEATNTTIVNKNFNADFESVKTLVTDKNYDNKFEEVKTEIGNKNFNSDFESIKTLINEKNFDTKFELIHKAIESSKKSFETQQTESLKTLTQSLSLQSKEINLLKTVLFLICGLIVVGIVVTILN